MRGCFRYWSFSLPFPLWSLCRVVFVKGAFFVDLLILDQKSKYSIFKLGGAPMHEQITKN